MRKNLILIFIFIILFSCQEEITLDLPKAETKLVVEGAIENGFPAYVILSKNQGYFETIDANTYNSLFVTDAIVTITRDDNISHELTLINESIINQIELLLDTIINIPPNTIYIDLEELLNPSNFSIANRSYTLDILWQNKSITANTTIPTPTPLDCLWVEQDLNLGPEQDYKCDIRAIYSDPVEQQNNILIKSKRIQHFERDDTLKCELINNPDLTLKLVDSGSDILINGQTFETYFPRPRDGGFPSGKYNSKHYKKCDNGNDSTLCHEDIVLIKFCQIDEPSMKFWRGLTRQAGTNGNPFAEPMNLVSNVTNGLGIFTGYGSVYYKVPIVKDTSIFEQYSPQIIDIF